MAEVIQHSKMWAVRRQYRRADVKASDNLPSLGSEKIGCGSVSDSMDSIKGIQQQLPSG